MRLIKLSSNLEKFKTVDFKYGLNIIIGERTDPDNKDTKDSYNGVGKSLLIEILHFCLGSNKISAFSKNIPEAIFYLEFEDYNKNIHKITRECSDKQAISLDNKRYDKLTDFQDKMQELVFVDVPDQKGLSFRSLISRFIRRYKSNYSKYYNYVKNEQPYNEVVVNSYLLGLDSNIVERKMNVKDITTTLNNAKKSLKQDKLLLEYFKGNKDIKFQLTELKEQKERFENQIQNFKVAENYNEMKENSDKLSQQKNILNNELFIINRNIDKIEKANSVEIQLKPEELFDMYKETSLLFPETVIRTIEEVTEFHENLLKNRAEVYSTQLKAFRERKNEIEHQLKEVSNKLNDSLIFLNKHGALNEYVALNSRYNKIVEQYNKLNDYNKLIKDYEFELSVKKKEKEDIKIDIKSYLDESIDVQEKLMKQFRFFSKQFYKDKSSGLSINGNYKDNKIAWNIHADIEDDSSDGVNEVLIFCFDFTMFSTGNHNVYFLFHDSRLFSNMDPRQRYTALTVADDFLSKNPNLQYIVSLNEDMIESIKPMVEENMFEDLNNIIEDSRILTLKDDKPENKLLGFQRNIPYDK